MTSSNEKNNQQIISSKENKKHESQSTWLVIGLINVTAIVLVALCALYVEDMVSRWALYFLIVLMDVVASTLVYNFMLGLYIVKRLFLMIPTLIGITIISFVMIRLAPGNPSDLLEQRGGDVVQKSQEVSFETIDQFRRKFHLDKPLHIQYWLWLKKMATFDFGVSNSYPGKSVNDLLKVSLPKTLIISIISIFFVYIIAIPLGVVSSVKENSLLDKSLTVALFMLYSLPAFFVAIWLVSLLASNESIQLFPAKGLDLDKPLGEIMWHLTLPVFCSSFAGYAYLSRQMRGGMLDVLRQDYIRTARAKGLKEKTVVLKHAMRNSLIPIVTIASTILPALIGGSVIIEQVFNIKGMGWLAFEAILKRDYDLIMAVFYLSSILTLVGILVSDVLYVLVNPRISFEKS